MTELSRERSLPDIERAVCEAALGRAAEKLRRLQAAAEAVVGDVPTPLVTQLLESIWQDAKIFYNTVNSFKHFDATVTGFLLTADALFGEVRKIANKFNLSFNVTDASPVGLTAPASRGEQQSNSGKADQKSKDQEPDGWEKLFGEFGDRLADITQQLRDLGKLYISQGFNLTAEQLIEARTALFVFDEMIAAGQELKRRFPSHAEEINDKIDAANNFTAAARNALTEFTRYRPAPPGGTGNKPPGDGNGTGAEAENPAEKANALVKALETELDNIEDMVFVVSDQHSDVEKEFDTLYKELSEKIKPLVSPEEARRLEILIRESHYRHLKAAYLQRVLFLEGANKGTSYVLGQHADVITPKVLSIAENLLKRLELLKAPKLKDYIRDYDRMSREVSHRIGTDGAWSGLWEYVLGTTASRTPPKPGEFTEDNLSLNGVHIGGLMRNGLIEKDEKEIGKEPHAVLGDKTATIESRTQLGQKEKVTFKETAFGWCWRMFDKVYDGTLKIPAPTQEPPYISTANIHATYNDLVDFVYGEEQIQSGGSPRFDKHTVLMAFRTHAMWTLNISFLAKGSASIADNWYYMYHWFEYCSDYALSQKSAFDWLQTGLLFGYHGANPLKTLFGENYIKVEDILKQKGFLGGEGFNANAKKHEHHLLEKGFTNFGQLVNAPLIKLPNVDRGDEYEYETERVLVTGPDSRNPNGTQKYIYRLKREQTEDGSVGQPIKKYKMVDGRRVPRHNTPSLAGPLQYMLMHDQSTDPPRIQRFYEGFVTDADRNVLVPKMVKDRSGKDIPNPELKNIKNPKEGKYVSFEDMKDEETGEYLYELMQWDESKRDIYTYYTQIGLNGMNFLTKLLKAPTAEFLKNMGDPDFIAEMRKQSGYSMRLFPVVGPMIAAKDKLVEGTETTMASAIMNRTIFQLVFAACLIQTNPMLEKPWTKHKVEEYLGNLVGRRAISHEEREAIEMVIDAARKFQLYWEAFTQSMQEQIISRSKVH